jgi:hypothetical protein
MGIDGSPYFSSNLDVDAVTILRQLAICYYFGNLC